MFAWLEQLGHEINHSLPSSAEGKNERSCTPSPSIRLHGLDREKFTFGWELLSDTL
jgi:hypothetical protein